MTCTGSGRRPPTPASCSVDADARFSASCGKQRPWTPTSRRAEPPNLGTMSQHPTRRAAAVRPGTPVSDGQSPVTDPHECALRTDMGHSLGKRMVSVKTGPGKCWMSVCKQENTSARASALTEVPTRDSNPGSVRAALRSASTGVWGADRVSVLQRPGHVRPDAAPAPVPGARELPPAPALSPPGRPGGLHEVGTSANPGRPHGGPTLWGGGSARGSGRVPALLL